MLDYQSAYRLSRKVGDLRTQALALQSIAQIYTDAEDFSEALKYQRQAIDVSGQDKMLLLSAFNNTGVSYLGLKQYRLAEEHYKKALRLADELDSSYLAIQILSNIALTQTELREFDSAAATLRQAYSLAEQSSASRWRPVTDGVAALLAFRRNDLESAQSLIQAALSEAARTKASIPTRDIYKTAYQVFRASGDNSSALQALERFKSIDDEQRALAASANAALMNARFNFTNQELRIRDLRVAQERAATRFRNRMLLALLSAAAIISTLLLIGILSIRRSRNQVRAANISLRSTNVALEKALAAKTEFLATTSHEIRTPLNGILGMTQVLLAGRQLDPTLRSRIELVHGAGETMKALVDDILDVAKMETGELRIQTGEMDLKRLLEDAVTVWTGQAETKRIGIAFDLADCPGHIIADEVRLRQIIFNLMSNAIKFTDRGQVRLEAFAEERDDGEQLVVRVTDSGIGIPADRMDDIFESFRQVDGGVTRRHGGTGLGLAICRSLARAMGGDVTAASTLGTGSTFTLAIPLARAVIEAVPQSRVAAISLVTAELLVIEPNPLGQGIMRALLAGQCAGVQFAIDVASALELIGSGTIDHVVAEGSALGLDPASAGALAAAVHATGARFSLLWREPAPELLAELAAAGITHVISKPISAAELLSEMNTVYRDQIGSRDIAA